MLTTFFVQVDELDEGESEIARQVPSPLPPRSMPARGGSGPRRGFALRPAGFTPLHPRSAEQPRSYEQDDFAGGSRYHPMQQSRQLSSYPVGAQAGRGGQWSERDRGGGRQEGNAWSDEGWRQDTSKHRFQNNNAQLQGMHSQSPNSQERAMPWTHSGAGEGPGDRCGDETNHYLQKTHERRQGPPSNIHIQPAQKTNARSNADILGVCRLSCCAYPFCLALVLDVLRVPQSPISGLDP